MALGEVGLALDPSQVRPGVGVLEPLPEGADAAQGVGVQGRDLRALEGARELVEREAQAGSTIAVMPPAQPALRGSGP